MDPAELTLFKKEVIWNRNKCCRNTDWNGMLYDGEKVGLQPVDMVPRFPTIRLPNNSEYPHLFKPIVLPAQLLIKQLNSHSWFQLRLFRDLSFSLYSHVCNDPCRDSVDQLHDEVVNEQ
jgi:hypothetical protein